MTVKKQFKVTARTLGDFVEATREVSPECKIMGVTFDQVDGTTYSVTLTFEHIEET